MPAARKKRRIETTEFVIAIDTREQKPFDFSGITNARTRRTIVPRCRRMTLKTGDYSLVGFENEMALERKSMSDLFGVVGRDRQRFTRELERLADFRYAAIVIESDIQDIFMSPPPQTRVSPTSVVNSLLSWSVRFGVHVVTMPSRKDAEHAAFFLLQAFWNRVRNEVKD